MLAVASIVGYLVGSIPFALLVGRRWAGVDVRRAGSGNVGAANAYRTGGSAAGAVTAACDLAKGAAAVLLTRAMGGGEQATALAAVAAVLGHCYPIWLRFRGGKGVATTCGAFSVLAPVAAAIAVAAFVAVVWMTRYVSVGSIAGAAVLGPLAWMTDAPSGAALAGVCASAIVISRHRLNIARLREGVERRLGERA